MNTKSQTLNSTNILKLKSHMETSQLLHKWERDTLPINSQSKRQPNIQNKLNNTIQSKTLPLDNNNLKHELAKLWSKSLLYLRNQSNYITIRIISAHLDSRHVYKKLRQQHRNLLEKERGRWRDWEKHTP